VRQRWFGATGQRVPEIVADGDEAIPLGDALVLDDVTDLDRLQKAHAEGTPVVVRADSPEGVRAALARPEVASVLVPKGRQDLLELDLTKLTYG
jgi:hypothetical protein